MAQQQPRRRGTHFSGSLGQNEENKEIQKGLLIAGQRETNPFGTFHDV